MFRDRQDVEFIKNGKMKTESEVKRYMSEIRTRLQGKYVVLVYAQELLDRYEEIAFWAIRQGKSVPYVSEEVLLNDADDWVIYSKGGCSLIYEHEIAERFGRSYSHNVLWLNLQADALNEACRILCKIAQKVRI